MGEKKKQRTRDQALRCERCFGTTPDATLVVRSEDGQLSVYVESHGAKCGIVELDLVGVLDLRVALQQFVQTGSIE